MFTGRPFKFTEIRPTHHFKIRRIINIKVAILAAHFYLAKLYLSLYIGS